MSRALEEQTVVVTGAGRGLGAAVATAFAREGARVAVNYRNSRSAAEALVAGLGERAFAVQADVREREDVVRMVDEIRERAGSPTTLVHNALAD